MSIALAQAEIATIEQEIAQRQKRLDKLRTYIEVGQEFSGISEPASRPSKPPVAPQPAAGTAKPADGDKPGKPGKAGTGYMATALARVIQLLEQGGKPMTTADLAARLVTEGMDLGPKPNANLSGILTRAKDQLDNRGKTVGWYLVGREWVAPAVEAAEKPRKGSKATPTLAGDDAVVLHAGDAAFVANMLAGDDAEDEAEAADEVAKPDDAPKATEASDTGTDAPQATEASDKGTDAPQAVDEAAKPDEAPKAPE